MIRLIGIDEYDEYGHINVYIYMYTCIYICVCVNLPMQSSVYIMLCQLPAKIGKD